MKRLIEDVRQGQRDGGGSCLMYIVEAIIILVGLWLIFGGVGG